MHVDATECGVCSLEQGIDTEKRNVLMMVEEVVSQLSACGEKLLLALGNSTEYIYRCMVERLSSPAGPSHLQQWHELLHLSPCYRLRERVRRTSAHMFRGLPAPASLFIIVLFFVLLPCLHIPVLDVVPLPLFRQSVAAGQA